MSDEDGQTDYTGYSITELFQARDSIDSEKYPVNYQSICEAINTHPQKAQAEAYKSEQKADTDGGIPVGSHGFIELKMKKKFVLPFRILMILLAIWPVLMVHESIVTGTASIRGSEVIRGEDWGYYVEVAKDAMIALLFLWLASFGVKAKLDET